METYKIIKVTKFWGIKLEIIIARHLTMDEALAKIFNMEKYSTHEIFHIVKE